MKSSFKTVKYKYPKRKMSKGHNLQKNGNDHKQMKKCSTSFIIKEIQIKTNNQIPIFFIYQNGKEKPKGRGN